MDVFERQERLFAEWNGIDEPQPAQKTDWRHRCSASLGKRGGRCPNEATKRCVCTRVRGKGRVTRAIYLRCGEHIVGSAEEVYDI